MAEVMSPPKLMVNTARATSPRSMMPLRVPNSAAAVHHSVMWTRNSRIGARSTAVTSASVGARPSVIHRRPERSHPSLQMMATGTTATR